VGNLSQPQTVVKLVVKNAGVLFLPNKYNYLLTKNGGGCEIRTHEWIAPLPVFKTGAFNRSANPP
tara:strand:- start:273 stop:467 length:195 start_codon:yes stop_codon:yes gene_type:complete